MMKKRISAIAIASMFLAGSAYASGYRIPEQSIDSTAKSGANVASAINADTTYFNPANMSFIDDNWMVEVDLTYIHLTSISYDDARSSTMSGDSEKENFLLPTLFLVSPNYADFRFGLSITEPFGLAKRWKDPYPRTFSEKFSLVTVEVNPTVSYMISDKFSVAGGVRMLYSHGQAIMNGVITSSGVSLYQDLDADSIDWGYNLAAAFKPTEESNISVTYRSQIDMSLEGDVTLVTNTGPFNRLSMNASSDSFVAPAVLAISGSYTFDKLTLELTIDRTFWSAYEDLLIEYDSTPLNPVLAAAGGPHAKNWDDTNAYRLGVSYEMNDELTLMGGLAYDENPVPDDTVSFELPDSDAILFSVGARYKITESLEAGVAALYDYKLEREVTNSRVDGEFTGTSAFLISAGLSYSF